MRQQSPEPPTGKGNNKQNTAPLLSASEQHLLDEVRRAAGETQKMIINLVMFTATLFNLGCAALLNYGLSGYVGALSSILFFTLKSLPANKRLSVPGQRLISALLVSLYAAATILVGMLLAVNELNDKL